MRPMLAAPYSSVLARWPLYATPKIDGIRAVVLSGLALGRSLKPFPNPIIRAALADPTLEGCDGELVVLNPDGTIAEFHKTSSFVNSRELGQSLPSWAYFIFDLIVPNTPHKDRLKKLEEKAKSWPSFAKLLAPKVCWNPSEAASFAGECLEKGFEGICLRDPEAYYKYGRSTQAEQALLKWKPFAEAEGRIVGFCPLTHNLNPTQINPLGLTERSSRKEGLVESDKLLGALEVESPYFTKPFWLGSGFTESQRRELWARRQSLLGALVTFKWQPYGSTPEAPRFPVFKCIRWDKETEEEEQ